MKKVLMFDSWKVFVFSIIPIIFPDNLFGFVLTIAFLIACAYWAYYLAEGLYSKLPGGHDLNLNKFKLFLIIPIVYIVLVTFLMDGGYSINNNNIGEYGPIAFVLIPLHLFCMFCIFYCIYFLAKAIVCVDKQNKNIQTADYIGYFFGFWFFPFGIWFIQPKIQQIFTEK